jgi:hypothetical protein
MRIMQVFRSARDNHVISELEMAGASPTTPIPIVGDEVRWVHDESVYSGRVTARLISYCRADKIGLDRADEIDVTAELTVESVK